MSSHCSGKPPATVLIQYKDGKKEEVVISSVPITVEVKKKAGIETEDPDPNAPTGGCCDIGYKVKVTVKYCSLGSTPNTCVGETITEEIEGEVAGKILGFRITQFLGTDNSLEYTRRGCDGVEQTASLYNVGSASKLVGYSIKSIARADGKPDICDPPGEDDKLCTITIKNNNGGIVYSKDSECPIKYKVRCGNECAEGEIRCQSNTYPGYCCIDCGDLARDLRR